MLFYIISMGSRDETETRRRIKRALSEERRGEYTDYDKQGLQKLAKTIIAKVAQEQTARQKN